jgi:hypothetical protein
MFVKLTDCRLRIYKNKVLRKLLEIGDMTCEPLNDPGVQIPTTVHDSGVLNWSYPKVDSGIRYNSDIWGFQGCREHRGHDWMASLLTARRTPVSAHNWHMSICCMQAIKECTYWHLQVPHLSVIVIILAVLTELFNQWYVEVHLVVCEILWRKKKFA